MAVLRVLGAGLFLACCRAQEADYVAASSAGVGEEAAASAAQEPPVPPPATPPPPPATTPPPPPPPARRLSGSDWTPTNFIYLKGPKAHAFRAFVGSSVGSVTSIHLEQGTIDWKFEPPVALGAASQMYHKRGTIVMATDQGQIQALNANTGDPMWDHECPSTVLHTILDVGGKHDGFALVCKTHVNYRTIDGVSRWQSPATNLKAAYTTRDLGAICLMSLIHDHTVVLKFDVEDGHTISNTTVPPLVDAAIRAGNYIETGEHIIFKDGTELKTYPICGPTVGPMEALGLTVSASAVLHEIQDSPEWFGIWDAGVTKIVHLTSEGTIGVMRTEPGTAVLGPAHGAVYGEAGKFMAVAKLDQATGSWHVHVKRPNGDLYRVASFPEAYNTAVHGNVETVLAQQLQSGEFRAIVTTSLKQLVAVEAKKLKWARGTVDTQRAEL